MLINQRHSTLFSFLGCVLLIPSCILLAYPQTILGFMAIIGLVIACLSLTVAAMIDLSSAYLQLKHAHEITAINNAKRHVRTQFYQILGAVFFLTASIMYLPILANDIIFGTTAAELGTWVFRCGSFAYLGSSCRHLNDLIKNIQSQMILHKQEIAKFIAIISFISGAIFYILGGIAGQFKIGDVSLMSRLWVIGSIGFTVGSFIFFIMGNVPRVRQNL